MPLIQFHKISSRFLAEQVAATTREVSNEAVVVSQDISRIKHIHSSRQQKERAQSFYTSPWSYKNLNNLYSYLNKISRVFD